MSFFFPLQSRGPGFWGKKLGSSSHFNLCSEPPRAAAFAPRDRASTTPRASLCRLVSALSTFSRGRWKKEGKKERRNFTLIHFFFFLKKKKEELAKKKEGGKWAISPPRARERHERPLRRATAEGAVVKTESSEGVVFSRKSRARSRIRGIGLLTVCRRRQNENRASRGLEGGDREIAQRIDPPRIGWDASRKGADSIRE